MIRYGLLASCMLSAGALAAATPAFVTRYAPGQLGGITSVLRYRVARPDREQVRYIFLTGSGARLPEEVQVLDPGLTPVTLSDEDGADCTLSHVELVPGSRPIVISAVRIFSPRLEDNDQSAPAAMAIQIYRPQPGEDPGESAVVLRATGTPVRSAPLCDRAAVRRAMLGVVRKG